MRSRRNTRSASIAAAIRSRRSRQDMHFKTRQHIRFVEEKFAGFHLSTMLTDLTLCSRRANVRKQGLTNHINFAPFPTLLRETVMRILR